MLCLFVSAVILLLLLPLVPESPRYLLVKGRTEQAQQVLKKVRQTGLVMPRCMLAQLYVSVSGRLLDAPLAYHPESIRLREVRVCSFYLRMLCCVLLLKGRTEKAQQVLKKVRQTGRMTHQYLMPYVYGSMTVRPSEVVVASL
jgi:hypothetical protein